MAYWKIIIVTIFYYTFLAHSCCRSQSTTICDNNNIITLEANESISYIESYNFPYDYSGSNGDCQVTIVTNDNYIKVKIERYLRRNSGTALKIFNDKNVIVTSKTLEVGKTYSITTKKVNMTHWSSGDTNDAFRISYQSVKNYAEDEEFSDWKWVLIAVISVLILISVWHLLREKNRRLAPNNPQPQPPQSTIPNPTQTQDTGSNVEMAPETSPSQDAVINRDDPPPYEEAVHYPKKDESGIAYVPYVPVQPELTPNTHASYTNIGQRTVSNSESTSIGSRDQSTVANPYAFNFESNRMTPNSNYPEIADETLYSSEVSGREISDITNQNSGLEPVVLEMENNCVQTLDTGETLQGSTSRSNSV